MYANKKGEPLDYGFYDDYCQPSILQQQQHINITYLTEDPYSVLLLEWVPTRQ